MSLLTEPKNLQKEQELALNFIRGNDNTPYPDSRVNPGSGSIRMNAKVLLQLAYSIPRVQDYPFAFVTHSERHGHRVWGYNTVDVSMYSYEKLKLVVLPLLRRPADAQSIPGKLPYTISDFIKRNGQPPLLVYSTGDRFTKFTFIETSSVRPHDLHDLIVAVSMATIGFQNSQEGLLLRITGSELPHNYVTGIVGNTWENQEKDMLYQVSDS